MFVLEDRFANEIIAHARQETPNECCGILVGKDTRVLKLYRTTNVEKSPYRYTIDPKEMLQIMREADASGWEIVAFYHSHTHSEAYPSATDIRLASWPDATYLLVSLANPSQPVVRGFRISDGTVVEQPLRIVRG